MIIKTMTITRARISRNWKKKKINTNYKFPQKGEN